MRNGPSLTSSSSRSSSPSSSPPSPWLAAPREPVVSLVPIAPDMPASEAGGGPSSPSRAIFFTTMRARAIRMPCPRSRVPDVAPPSVVVVPPSVVTEPPALTSTESLPLPVHPTPTRNIAAMATLSFLAFMTPLLSALILLEPLSHWSRPRSADGRLRILFKIVLRKLNAWVGGPVRNLIGLSAVGAVLALPYAAPAADRPIGGSRAAMTAAPLEGSSTPPASGLPTEAGGAAQRSPVHVRFLIGLLTLPPPLAAAVDG